MSPTSDNSVTETLKQLFDKELVEVTRNKVVLPFSIDRILTDLIQAGVTSFDAINLLYVIKPYLQKGMSTNEISRIIFKGLQEAGYDETDIFLGTFLKPISIVFSDDESRDFTYKEIKNLVKTALNSFDVVLITEW